VNVLITVLAKGPILRQPSPVKQDSTVSTPSVTISTEVAFIDNKDRNDVTAELSDSDAGANEEIPLITEEDVGKLVGKF
jgi:hypothetical protein